MDAQEIVAGLGGADNIVEIEPCTTRLRAEVRDPSLVDEGALKRAGQRSRGSEPQRAGAGAPALVPGHAGQGAVGALALERRLGAGAELHAPLRAPR